MTDRLRVEVVGVPFNSSGLGDGVARAPAALREAGLMEALGEAGIDALDTGDLDLGPTTPDRDASSGIIAPAALATMARTVREAVAETVGRKVFPLILGGDCPVLLGCLGSAPGERPPGLLFIDGHEDAWPPQRSTTGEAADMELGLLLGQAVDTLSDELRREIPVLDPSAVVIVGARDEAELAEAGIRSISDRVESIRLDALAANPAAVAGLPADRLAARGPWWLHVDLDVLSTESLGAVDYPQPGGLRWPALTAITRRSLVTPRIIGWDVTIYNPDLDPGARGARRIVRYLADSLRA